MIAAVHYVKTAVKTFTPDEIIPEDVLTEDAKKRLLRCGAIAVKEESAKTEPTETESEPAADEMPDEADAVEEAENDGEPEKIELDLSDCVVPKKRRKK